MSMTTITEPFYGLYKGLVVNNADPEGLGRITATVPQVFGDNSTATTWAFPCAPLLAFSLPDPGAGVWIAFEGGDVDYPIWCGVWSFNSSTGTTFMGPVTILAQQGGTVPALLIKATTGGSSQLFQIKDSLNEIIEIAGITGGFAVYGDHLGVRHEALMPKLSFDGTTNPPSEQIPNSAGNRIWYLDGPPSATTILTGSPATNDIAYDFTNNWLRWICTEGGTPSSATWVVNQIGYQAAYDPVTSNYSMTSASGGTWYVADLTSGTSPSITLPDDGFTYKVEFLCSYWKCSTASECFIGIGTSTSNILAGTQNPSLSTIGQWLGGLVIPSVVGEGQAIGVYTNAPTTGYTITVGAGSSGAVTPSSLTATRTL